MALRAENPEYSTIPESKARQDGFGAAWNSRNVPGMALENQGMLWAGRGLQGDQELGIGNSSPWPRNEDGVGGPR